MVKGEALEYFDLNIGQNYLSDWSASLALREIVANGIDEKGEGNFDFNWLENGTIIIKDYAEGLKPEQLIFQGYDKRNRNDKIGKFGFGLKDAIGVLWSENIIVEIRSTGYKFTFEMKEKSKGCKFKTLHACIRKFEADNFKGTEFTIYNCPFTDYEEARMNFIRYENPTILSRTTKGQILEKDTSSVTNIYLNGMKIAEDNKLRFSYNITNPSSKIKNGLNRERKYVSRIVYQSDLVNMLNKNEEEIVSDILVEQLKNSYEGNNMSEITWKDVIIKTCNYILKNNKTIFVSSEDREKTMNLINY
ncbi:ATP-binding protein [Desnuesiella massiliensis]|uniref:ATP-binding protein n=1 Tax=Desnuesiella massiliensis TaxID=1650662 RepID=UPI0006E29880|nr:ATP-binding protein [Desnuesiella massiliensis]